jgi:outer membrane protein assembly factor BamB
MLRDAKRGKFAVQVVWAFDRFGRSMVAGFVRFVYAGPMRTGYAWGVVVAALTFSGCGRTLLDECSAVGGACGAPVQDAGTGSDAKADDAMSEDAPSDAVGTRSDSGGARGSSPPSMASSYLVNPAHTNAVADPSLAPPLAFLWTESFADSVTNYPLIAGGRVYLLLSGGTSGKLVALEKTSGATLWGPVDIGGSEVVGHAYDAERVFALTSDKGLLRAFDAATGRQLWSRALGSAPGNVGPPTAYRGIVYVAPNDAVIALDEVTGAILWKAKVDFPDYLPGGSSPAVSDDAVFVAYCGEAYAFDRTTGALVWQKRVDCKGGGSLAPAVYGGRVYVSELSGAFAVFDAQTGAAAGSVSSVYYPAFDGTRAFCNLRTPLQAVDLPSGARAWTFDGDMQLDSIPFAGGGTVYIASDSGKIFGVDETSGAEVWTTQADPLGAAPPVGGEGILIAHLYSGQGVVAYAHVDLPDASVVVGDGGVASAVVLASGEEPNGLALGDADVYWTDTGGGQVRSVNKNGGQAVTVSDAPGTDPWGLAVDSTRVYWSVPNFASGGMNATIMSIPLAGGAATTLASNLDSPELVVAGPSNVYWTALGPAAVESVPLDGGSVATIARDPLGGAGVAIDATDLYWSTGAGIFRAPLAGGAPTRIGPAADAIAVDSTNVYYVVETPNGSGLVARVPIAGGTPETLASGRTGSLPAVAVDDRNVYWIEGEGTIEEGAVAAVPKSGGIVAVLVSGLSDPSAIVVDGTGVYFDNPAGGGLVEKIPK